MRGNDFDLELFERAPRIKAEYRDYDEWVAHFSYNPKTTDECWTPPDVYDAVLAYVGTLIDMNGRTVVRPFFPGGSYEETEYPSGCIVVDNPPFSMFTRITEFYRDRGILFFLFGPGLTIGSGRGCIIVTGKQIRYENGACVPTEFCSNIPGLPTLSTAPELGELIEGCESQKTKGKKLKSYDFPEELLSVSDLRTIASGGVSFSVDECVKIRKLDNHKDLFGDHWLISKAKAEAKAKAKAAIPVLLSEYEEKVVQELGRKEPIPEL